MPTLAMSVREINRYDVLKRLLRQELNGPHAAALLTLSTRQVRRLKAAVRARGPAALIHAARGRPSNRRMPRREHDQIVTLLQKQYVDFKPTFATEKLAELHGIIRSPETIRQLMLAEGLWRPHAAQGEHRMWRERRAALGELLQFDGSYHDWFEGRAPTTCLLAAIDDATGKILKAQFAAHEGVVPVFRFWTRYCETHGKPRSIYLDRFSTYRMTQKVAVENHDLKTQFQRAMKELDIDLVFALSPQAKGRVERLFGTLQDRLVKELRLAGINTPEDGNRFLAETFLPRFNDQFSVAPRSRANLHRPLSAVEVRDLPATFARQETRTVTNDFTVSFKNQWYQLVEDQPVTVCKKDVALVEERLDGSVWIRLRGKYLGYRLLPERPKKLAEVPWVLEGHGSIEATRVPYRPPATHPWRQYERAKFRKLAALAL